MCGNCAIHMSVPRTLHYALLFYHCVGRWLTSSATKRSRKAACGPHGTPCLSTHLQKLRLTHPGVLQPDHNSHPPDLRATHHGDLPLGSAAMDLASLRMAPWRWGLLRALTLQERCKAFSRRTPLATPSGTARKPSGWRRRLQRSRRT